MTALYKKTVFECSECGQQYADYLNYCVGCAAKLDVPSFTSTNNESMPCLCDTCTWERSCCVVKYLPDAITGCRGYIDSRKVTAHIS